MPQRIAYLSLKGAAASGPPVDERLIGAGFEVGLVETTIRVRPVDQTDLLLSDLAYAEAAMRAEAEGYDAVVIGALPDYGIAAARAAVDIPVVGCGQASVQTALGLGDRFAIVTIWPETMSYIYDRILRDNHAEQRCTSVRYVSSPEEQASLSEQENFLTEMKAGREHMIERILLQIEAAADEGVGSVILGCNCMTPVARTLAARTSVPIVDPTAAGYRAAESLLALGVSHRRDPRVPLSTRQPLLAEMLGAADLAMTGQDEDCPVCVLGEDGTASCDVPAAPATVAASPV